MKNIFNKYYEFIKILKFYENLIGKKTLTKVILSGFIISTLELTGLALLFPFIKLSLDGIYSSQIIISIGILLIIFYLLRGFINGQLIKYQSKVSAFISSHLSHNIISKSLNSNYKLFIDNSSVKIAGSAYTNTNHAALLFQSLTNGSNEIIFLIFIFFSAIILNPTLSIYLLIFIFIFYRYPFKRLTRKIAQIGEETQKLDTAHHRFIFAMSSAIKDIKIMGLEKQFSNRNKKISKRHSDLFANYTYISSLQKIFIEITLACAIVVCILIFTLKGADIKRNAPLIVTLGMIAVRSAPAINRLSNSLNGFRYSLPFVKKLFEIQDITNNYKQVRDGFCPTFTGKYTIEKINFGFKNREILKNCSLTINFGEIIKIIGPSGAGKSTLLDVIAGILPPEKGKFSMDGKEFFPYLSRDFPSLVGYVPQFISLIDESLSYNITLELNPDKAKLWKAIKKSQLTKFVKNLTNGLDTILGEGGEGISGGQRQRIGIARALYREPSLLILDEVTSSLDNKTATEIMNQIYSMRGEVSILFVTHNSNNLKADKTYLLNEGKLIRKNKI
tara:strand:- start:784 stop:2463 length:1680 start_codon:yes stop_codon:yes gene_type:complete